MPNIKLQQVKNFDKLLKYLETELRWPVDGREIDDIAFPFDLEADLGLDKNEVAKVRHVYRLKKMHKKQPFGIFFVDFEGKKMPVSVLKRILRNLALKRKANAKAADQLAWDVEDLIFISAVGEEKDSTREISFAHFRKEPDNRHVLKVMAWDGGDTPLKMDHLDDVLHEFLRFPDDTNDVDAWRKSWTAAFRTGIRQNIRRSEELAQALAALAMRINKEALSLIKKESANGPLKTLHAGFKDALIHDLTEEAFTDCYAQTITYGLLTAAITKVNQAGVKDLTSTSVLEMVPSTNPFLKDILSSFLEAGGRGEKGIDFDDLGVQDVIDLLRAESTDLPNILRDFGNLTQDEDPVIHFYETFLKIYNKEERIKRGAFYTPRPVVSYIVRSVDELLRKDFGLEDGLADTTTWGEMIKRNPAIKLPPLTDNPGEKKTIKETEPFVQILDPATGTATFLVEVINIIEKKVKAKAWAKLKNGPYDHDQHSKRDEVLKAWNEYVPEHLLKRLHAYELMMAPYVIAHMKVGLKLAETGYRFATEERARIYLTNALEPAKDFKERLNFDIPALAIEAKQVNEVKQRKKFTVIIGNPPYANFGQLNKIESILEKLELYKKGLNERKINLDDDYIKFIRFSHAMIGGSGVGIIGMITNNSFLDGITHRAMRASLLADFDVISVCDLHGNSRKGEVSHDGRRDENIFDIQQGVGISFLVRKTTLKKNDVCELRTKDILGSRRSKYDDLTSSSDSVLGYSKIDVVKFNQAFKKTKWGIEFGSDLNLFINRDADLLTAYGNFVGLLELFEINNSGIQTKRDGVAVAFTEKEMRGVMDDFARLPAEKIREKYELPEDGRDWTIASAKKDIIENQPLVCIIQYRPFDFRFMAYTGKSKGIIAYPRHSINQHMISGKNLGLVTCRNQDFETSAIVTKYPVDLRTYSSPGSVGTDYLFPLWLDSEDDLLDSRRPNIKVSALGALAKGLTPEDVFCYVYGVISSSSYVQKYAECLNIDFPRIPMPTDKAVMEYFVRAGKALIEIQTFRLGEVDGVSSQFFGSDRMVEKPFFEDGAIYINKEMKAGFRCSEQVWEAQVGGYRVCQKWIGFRSGRVLSAKDIQHFIRVLDSIKKSQDVVSKIDFFIAEKGGWPKAFQ